MENTRFHHYYDDLLVVPGGNGQAARDLDSITKHYIQQERTLDYAFRSHFHPYVGALVARLLESSVRGLEAADTEYVQNADGTTAMLDAKTPRPVLYEELAGSSGPYTVGDVVREKPVKELDFASTGAYAVYNWELFFHVPITIGIHLSRNQRYQEAQRWFHFIFDPTDDSDGPTPERFWKVRPFQSNTVRLIEDILVNLSSGEDEKLRRETLASIGAWKDNPFGPHAVARHRPTAYMFKTVMAYLDNLIAWGDSLFREDSREAINEATQLYVLAANLLGPRPQAVPRKRSVRPLTYANLVADADARSHLLKEIEAEIPFDLVQHQRGASDPSALRAVESIGRALYFCVPRNDKLLSYWDVVADRLFKIRNSLNIQGVFRQPPLFEPPIDPALLAKAVAAGVDVGAVISGTLQPLPLVRFRLLVQKAAELCAEVKSLGGELLATLEKGDAEALAILRARHERLALGLADEVRYGQWQEAIKTREALEKSLASAAQRYQHYERLLGSEVQLPPLEALDKAELEKLQLSVSEPQISRRDIRPEISSDPAAEGRKLSVKEVEELDKLSDAQTAQDVSAVLDGIAAILNLIPSFSVDGKPIGIGPGVEIGGVNFARALSAGASGSRALGARFGYEASRSAKMGAYDRRAQEWAFQSNSAVAEIEQIYKQLRAAQIREVVAEREWRNHQEEMKHAAEIEQFLTDDRAGKTTGQAFYAYMKREVRGLYGQCFQFAFDVAKKAERALQHELGNAGLGFLQMGYMGGREGLLAGEKLYLDVKRMEMAYHEQNQREYELTKHVSLLQVDPQALMRLRTTGGCTVALPEELFDLDGPGHYFRRIRSVAMSIPSVAGPYTSVNCTLTLLNSSIRTVPLLRDGGYAREGAEDDRFNDHFGSLQSIVTSSARNDSGLFEMNLGDERRLPFEGSGATSEWKLELPGDVRQFDYDTIADVILHLRYTAREGGGLLRAGAVANLKAKIAKAEAIGSVRLLSVRHEFPAEWMRFKSADIDGTTATAGLSLELLREHYPFWATEDRLQELKQVVLYARAPTGTTKIDLARNAGGQGEVDSIVADPSLRGLLVGKLVNVERPAPVGPFTLHFKDNNIDDLWLALAWGARATRPDRP